MQKNKTYILCILIIIISLLGVFFSWKYYIKLQSSAALHNLGNMAMKEYFNGNKSGLIQAEQFYSGSLDIIENSETRYNHDYVKNLLEKQEEKKENEQSEDGQEEKENSENQQESKSEENDQTESLEQNGEEGSEEGSGTEDGDKEEALTENEKQQLKKITEQIKAEQNYNQRYFNKADQGSNFQSSFESFFGELNRGTEKDW